MWSGRDRMTFLPDVNVWLAAAVEAHVHHPAAKMWMDDLGMEDRAVFCRTTEQSFMRLLTVRIAPGFEPVTNARAVAVYRSWRLDPLVEFRPEPTGIGRCWPELAEQPTVSPKRWTDAYLASFAIVGDYELVTFDRGFRGFDHAGLRWRLLEAGPSAGA